MIRTFNRQPFNVPTPDKEDVNHKYLNQYNWKGKVEDKNFLQVDQESFSDCNNVYVDEEGLLRSRPSLKVKNIIVKLPDGNVTLANIVDTFTFNNIIVYKSYTIENDNKVYRLTFVKEDSTSNPQYELSYNNTYFEDINLIMMDSKIFIFNKYRFDYYDIEDNTIYSAEDNIYIPTTKVITNGIDTKTQVDEKNELTNKEYTDYLFYDIFNQDFTTFIGKDVIVKIGEETYNINFKENNELVFVDKLTSLTTYEVANDMALGYNCEGIPLLDIAENGVIVMTTVSYGTTYNTPTSFRLRYSVDGLTFTSLPILQGSNGLGRVSRNGHYAIHYKEDGPYIISLLETREEGLKYPNWINLLQIQSSYSSFSDSKNYFSEENNHRYKMATSLNGYYIDDHNFAFTYASNPIPGRYRPDFPVYGNCYVVSCCNGTLNKDTIYALANKDSYNGTYSSSAKKINFSTGNKGVNYAREGAPHYGTINWAKLNYSGTSIVYTEDTNNSILQFTANFWGSYNPDSIEDTDSYVDFGTEGAEGITITMKSNKKVSNDDDNIVYTFDGYTAEQRGFPSLKFVLTKNTDGSSYTHTITVYFGQSIVYSPTVPNGYSAVFYPMLNTRFLPYYNSNTGKDIPFFGETYNIVPNIKMKISYINNTYSYTTIVLFKSYSVTRECLYEGVYHTSDIPHQDNVIDMKFSETLVSYSGGKWIVNTDLIRPCLRDDINIVDDIYVTTLEKDNNLLHTKVNTYKVETTDFYESPHPSEEQIQYLRISVDKTERIVYTEQSSKHSGDYPIYVKDYKSKTLRLSYDENYLLTDSLLFLNSTYGANDTLKYIELLDKGIEPIVMYYADTNKDSMYYFKDNVVYSNNSINVKNFMAIKVLQEGTNNYTLFDHITQLSNYYFSIGKTLYISKNIYEDDKFKWYLPAITKEEFDDVITNIHPISANEVAIFLNNSIYYTNYDSELEAYRYYKAKIQVGCKHGCDVITTFDGKYIIFVSERGMVAMSYQEFVASTEQALTFMSDNIYDTFYKYNTEPTSKNAIKLYKYSNYIFVYKEDSNKGFIFDLRTLSWWPISIDKNISKFVTINNEVKILSNMKLFNLNKSDINYYDYDGIKRTKVDWFIQSQKLHLGAVNYYKHIVNMTFNSVHDLSLLKENDYNAIDLNFKLQINNYRKQVNGNIGNKDDYKVVNYNVEIVRTFVQRLNYSKVNEFQYLLSYDDKNAVNVPFSVSGIIIKYKVGGEVR